VGDVADIISFNREFLKRYFSKPQEETLLALFGTDPKKWDMRWHEIVIVVGMKGGKNFVAESAASYVPYFIKCLKDPHSYFSDIVNPGSRYRYGLEKNFDIVNVSSVDETQAKKAFFNSIKDVLALTIDPKTGDNWFGRYAKLDLRETSGDLQQKQIEFPPEKPGMGTIRFLSFNSTATAPEGLHMFFFIADELSRAETEIKYKQASALYKLGTRNTTASFPKNVGKVLAFSYPNMTDYDLTWDLYETRNLVDYRYARKYTTFEYNPSKRKEDFSDEYKQDPIGALCTFECIKPISKDSFYQPYVDRIDKCRNPEIENKVKYTTHIRTVKLKNGEENRFTTLKVLDMKGDNKERCFFMDASKTKDRFVIGGGYTETRDVKKLKFFVGDQEDVIVTNKIFIVDILMVIEPAPNAPVDFISIGDYLSLIIKNFPNTKSINSDQWQNEKLLQEVSEKGIEAKSYRFSNPEQLEKYTRCKELIWAGLVHICEDTNAAHSVRDKDQQIGLTELWAREGKKLLKKGNKIDHPPNYSKDMQDVVAFLLNDLLQMELLNDGITRFEDWDDHKLKVYIEKYAIALLNEKQKGTEKSERIPNIAEKIGLSIRETTKVAEYFEEAYQYN
jgi:hypothetical protein